MVHETDSVYPTSEFHRNSLRPDKVLFTLGHFHKIIIYEFRAVLRIQCDLQPLSHTGLTACGILYKKLCFIIFLICRKTCVYIVYQFSAHITYRTCTRVGTVKGTDIGDIVRIAGLTNHDALTLQFTVFCFKNYRLTKTLKHNLYAFNIGSIYKSCILRIRECSVVKHIVAVIHLYKVNAPVNIGLGINCFVLICTNCCPGAKIGTDVIIHTKLQALCMDIISQSLKSRRKLIRFIYQLSILTLRLITSVIKYAVAVSEFIQSQFYHLVCHSLGQRLGVSAAECIPAVPAHGR